MWDVTWKAEDKYWKQTAILYRNENLLFKSTANPRYLIWWHLSLVWLRSVKTWPKWKQTAILYRNENLQSDNPKLRRETYSNRTCMLCDFGIDENTVHIVMLQGLSYDPCFPSLRRAVRGLEPPERNGEISLNPPGTGWFWDLGEEDSDFCFL